MSSRRWVPGALATSVACALALSLVPAATAAPADPDSADAVRVAEDRQPALRGLERAAEASQGRAGGTASIGRVVQRGGASLPAKPRNDTIVDVPVNPADASIALNLVPYHEFAPRLRALQASDRVSVEVIGQSVQGRDLHLVVITEPMSDREWADWQRLSDLRTDDPAAAAALLGAGGYDGWRTPLFVNNNIHGNEWEGTDASFQVMEELAFDTDERTTRLVEDHVIAFVVSNNPDGRVDATRANTNGFDMNRDFITQSQPEVRTVRDQIIRYNPLTFLDQHGYVAQTLIEPTTGPHGENYEYDLYIKHALRNALAMEAQVLADLGDEFRARNNSGATGPVLTQARIPYRDNADGWDDWPPIFTPMYAMYHGAVGHTIEFPHNPRGTALSQAERWERTRLNTEIAVATIQGNFDYANENADEILADQVELFRRGAAGEPSRPIDDPLALELAGFDNANTYEQEYPRAYVIPAGADQRSAVAAARLVQFLVDNDVQVKAAKAPVRIGGTRYEAGSYVVDMHQAKRGLANTIMDVGRDVSADFPTMYDISAWSLGELWGASFDVVEADEWPRNLPRNLLVDVRSTAPTGSFPAGKRAGYTFEVGSATDVAALNALAAAGLTLGRLADGTFVVSGDAAQVRRVSQELGTAFGVATARDVAAAAPFSGSRIAVAGLADEVFALRSMGFDVTTVTTAGFNAGQYRFADFDALWVSSTALNPLDLDATRQAAFSAWLAGGGNVVGRGTNGATFNTRAGLLPVTVQNVRNDANGIVAVVNDPASPVTGDALDVAFVSSPRVFTVGGDGVRVDQRLGGAGFFLAGHWIGSDAFAGRAVVVSGEARGGQVTLFGTEPLYRSHPEGLWTQVAAALWR